MDVLWLGHCILPVLLPPLSFSIFCCLFTFNWVHRHFVVVFSLMVVFFLFLIVFQVLLFFNLFSFYVCRGVSFFNCYFVTTYKYVVSRLAVLQFYCRLLIFCHFILFASFFWVLIFLFNIVFTIQVLQLYFFVYFLWSFFPFQFSASDISFHLSFCWRSTFTCRSIIFCCFDLWSFNIRCCVFSRVLACDMVRLYSLCCRYIIRSLHFLVVFVLFLRFLFCAALFLSSFVVPFSSYSHLLCSIVP